MTVLSGWMAGYQRSWLVPYIVAGVVVWTVVVPQAMAYAQIAELPPEVGLMAAPGAMVAYALLGTSRSLVVSATTATSALSAAAIGPLAGGDTARFALLSAGLAIITAGVLVAAGLLRLGRVTDFVSKAVMTGFLFGLGLTVALAQVSKLLGLPETDGNFFAALGELLGQLGDVHGLTLAVGAGSVVLLLVLRELALGPPGR